MPSNFSAKAPGRRSSIAGRKWAAIALFGVIGSGSAFAASVTITTGPFGQTSELDNVIYGTGYPVPSVSDLPTSLPFSQTNSASKDDDSAQATYDLSNDAFTVTISDARTIYTAFTSGSVFFTVQPSVAGNTVNYSLTGSYTVQNSGTDSGAINFSSSLFDWTTFTSLVNSQQASIIDSLNKSFVLGQLQGTSSSDFTGSLTGTLTPGHIYEWFYQGSIGPYFYADTALTEGNGRVSLAFSESAGASAVPLPASAWSGLALLAAMAGSGLLRYRKQTS